MGSDHLEKRIIWGLIVWSSLCFFLILATYFRFLSAETSGSVSGVAYLASLVWSTR